jgi:hypothetical protein
VARLQPKMARPDPARRGPVMTGRRRKASGGQAIIIPA